MLKLFFNFFILLFSINASDSTAVLYSKDSRFGVVEVIPTGTPGLLAVTQNKNYAVYHSIFSQDDPTIMGFEYEHFATTSFCFTKGAHQNVLLLGLGGGDFLYYGVNYFPNIKADVVEINPAMIDLVREFRKPCYKNAANYFCEDAFKFVVNIKQKYDLIFCDLYFDTPSSSENYVNFFKKLNSVLNHGGVLVFNAYHPFTPRAVVEELFKTFANITVQVTNDGANVVFICYDGPAKGKEKLEASAKSLQEKHSFRYSLPDLLRKVQFIAPVDYEKWINKFPVLD